MIHRGVFSIPNIIPKRFPIYLWVQPNVYNFNFFNLTKLEVNPKETSNKAYTNINAHLLIILQASIRSFVPTEKNIALYQCCKF